MPLEVTLKISKTSYANESFDALKDRMGTELLEGFNYGDIQTGDDYPPVFMYVRHSGIEPVNAVRLFLKTAGTDWGGFVFSSPSSKFPYNPHYFRLGGLDGNGIPRQSTIDYEFFRTQARDNPEMGMRLHLNRSDEFIRTNGLGYQNIGISSSPIILPVTAMDYSGTTNSQTPGRIYPDPLTLEGRGKSGDEAKIGVSFKLSPDTIGGGFAQIALSIAYRFTY